MEGKEEWRSIEATRNVFEIIENSCTNMFLISGCNAWYKMLSEMVVRDQKLVGVFSLPL